ncbi:hypothetical protein V1520DRAFT_291222 [Lipomyces starkeyi]|uniref:Uncharacterized protein n=1 Tax=Lipomyces starkeyi NRRL Y-11557 TaxID=675824 RepID=A0A1E3QCW1_LIPST|nr:hypothetical protein LIPSTDRAFT_985 [Lipomyces starkeyi NRRL Y-11557]
MPSFLRRSSTSGSAGSASGQENRRSRLNSLSAKITPEERDRMKQRTANIADPILTAMREEQPYEVSAAHLGEHSSVSPEMHMRDMFGNVIEDPDRSNPTRSRNERPLDTIRSFEYAATGDKHLKEQIFRERLPWEGRRYQPTYNASAYGDDTYDHVGADHYAPPPVVAASSVSSAPRPTIQLGNSGETYDSELPRPKKDKEKKRGLFGRKK